MLMRKVLCFLGLHAYKLYRVERHGHAYLQRVCAACDHRDRATHSALCPHDGGYCDIWWEELLDDAFPFLSWSKGDP